MLDAGVWVLGLGSVYWKIFSKIVLLFGFRPIKSTDIGTGFWALGIRYWVLGISYCVLDPSTKNLLPRTQDLEPRT